MNEKMVTFEYFYSLNGLNCIKGLHQIKPIFFCSVTKMPLQMSIGNVCKQRLILVYKMHFSYQTVSNLTKGIIKKLKRKNIFFIDLIT